MKHPEMISYYQNDTNFISKSSNNELKATNFVDKFVKKINIDYHDGFSIAEVDKKPLYAIKRDVYGNEFELISESRMIVVLNNDSTNAMLFSFIKENGKWKLSDIELEISEVLYEQLGFHYKYKKK